MPKPHYIVAATKTWNRKAFDSYREQLAGEWTFVSQQDELSTELVAKVSPRFVFFPHWSWVVPKEIWSNVECVCFHMTDLPYGRGGSPLQNLISRGNQNTSVTALRMEAELDAGPIYLKRPLCLSGRAQDIYERAADTVFDMIVEIVEQEPEPIPQVGDIVHFKRRSPSESVLPMQGTLENIYDHIRMLDAEGYPLAFIDHGGFRIEFSFASAKTPDEVSATVTIRSCANSSTQIKQNQRTDD